MTDLHTHILPGMDDGSPDAEESLRMLRMEAEQGIDAVALTPHYYRQKEKPEAFLERRRIAQEKLSAAIAALPPEQRRALPALTVGAEVFWAPGLLEYSEILRLCYGASRYLLVELPADPWERPLIDWLYDLTGHYGITPVIAHIDRYLFTQKPQMLRELFELGVPVQLSASMLLKCWGRSDVLRLVERGNVQLLVSDCHNTGRRPPNLGSALKVIEKKLGSQTVRRLSEASDAVITGKPN